MDIEHVCIVRLRTSYWSDNNKVCTQKTLSYLKKKCTGYNILQEDVLNIDVQIVITKITNLYDLPDGVYKVEICNTYTDWETNMVDDYDYKLVPFLDIPVIQKGSHRGSLFHT